MATSDVDNGSPRDWASTGLEVDDPWDLEKGQRFGGHKSIRVCNQGLVKYDILNNSSKNMNCKRPYTALNAQDKEVNQWRLARVKRYSKYGSKF